MGGSTEGKLPSGSIMATEDFIKLVVTAVIAFGLSFAIATTTGPFALFDKVRALVASRYGEDSWQHTGFNCPICCCFYVAMLVAWGCDTGFLGWLFAFGVMNLAIALSPD